MVEEDDVAELVTDRPALASAVEAVLAVDDERDRWSFDDVPVDTGLFGEIVGQGLVDEDDDGYHVVDPAAVRAGLAAAERSASGSYDETTTNGGGPREPEVTAGTGETNSPLAGVVSTVVGWLNRFTLATVPVRRVLAALAVVALFVAARTSAWGSVFRDGRVVLMGNDPYYYRYWVETLLAQSNGPLDFGVLADAPTGEPLLVATLWWVSSLLGGTADAAGLVLAWYPLVAGLVVAALLYVLGARVFGDDRIGLVAVAVLAVIPGHAMRTALGFADHHAFDYAWLMGVIVALAWLATLDTETDNDGALLDRIRWSGVIALGVAVAGLALSWNGSPVVMVPVALLLALRTLLAAAEDRSPVAANVSVLVGLGLAAVLSLAAHLLLGWQAPVVVLVPGLLCAGGVAVVALGAGARRLELSIRAHAGLQVVSAAAGLLALSVAVPAAVSQLRSRLTFLFAPRNIGETVSLFDPTRTFGADLVGLVVLFALPMLAVGLWRGLRGETPWLVVSVFGWWFVGLSALQLRFVGQLAPLAAFLAAIGFVRLLVYFDLTAASRAVGGLGTESDGSSPNNGSRGAEATWIERDSLTARAVVAVLVAGALLVGPAAAGVTDEVSSPAIDDRVYQSATWIADDVDRRGLNASESYVFSRWGNNRVFNYFVSGESQNYTYAQNNYTDFIDSGNATGWYERLRDRVGYVALEAIPRKDDTIFQHLWVTRGSRWADRGYDAVSHYRAVYASEDYRARVFTLVPGATLTGRASANTTVEASTRVSVPNDAFPYRHQTTSGLDGQYELVVPYPGSYEVTVGNETTTVSVSESAVRNGTSVSVGST